MDRADQRDMYLFCHDHRTDAYRIWGADVDDIWFEFLNDFFHISQWKGGEMVLIVHVKWKNERTWTIDGRPILILNCIFKGERWGNHPDIMTFLDEFMDDAVLCDGASINNWVV